MEHCSRCGAPVAEHAAFCGACGASLAAQNPDLGGGQFLVHKYQEAFARENRADFGIGKVYLLAFLLCVPLIFAGLSAIWLPIEATMVLLLAAGILLLVGIIWMSIIARPLIAGAQSTFVQDNATGILYKVTFSGNMTGGWDTASRLGSAVSNHNEILRMGRLAQIDRNSIDAVQDFQAGVNQPSDFERFFWGVPVQVVPMAQAALKPGTGRMRSLAYTNAKGARRTMKLANAYPTLFDALSTNS